MGYFVPEMTGSKAVGNAKSRGEVFSDAHRRNVPSSPSDRTAGQCFCVVASATCTSGVRYYGYRYYSPELGRWPSRDPIHEHGFQSVVSYVYPELIYEGYGLLDEAGEIQKELNSYLYCDNAPIILIDLLGLRNIARDGQPRRGSRRHGSYLTFTISCPDCQRVDDVKVHGENRVIDCIAIAKYPSNATKRQEFIQEWRKRGIDGHKDTRDINCTGDDVTVETWMRSRFAGRRPPFMTARARYVACYRSFIYISYICVDCPETSE